MHLVCIPFASVDEREELGPESTHHVVVLQFGHKVVRVAYQGVPIHSILDFPVHDPRVKETLRVDQSLIKVKAIGPDRLTENARTG